jgi:pimeloyl-ACP methyl ester carboxylesterase
LRIEAGPSPVPKPVNVRSRRAYFDCRYGQLHVRTAFPTTGGFDEKVTLFCLHAAGTSGRQFSGFLPLAAAQRSVYAPDLPGSGESDRAPAPGPVESAAAVADLAADLRLRQVDVLGFREGTAVAIEFASARPDLVRRLVLIGAASSSRLPAQATVIDAADYPDEPFNGAPQAMVDLLDSILYR